MSMIDTTAIKAAAAGRWSEILASLGGCPAELLDGKHHPCPRCGGRDRFRLLDAATGVVFCNQCFSERNGDGLAALGWLRDWEFRQTVAELTNYLAINRKGNGDGQLPSKGKKPATIYPTARAALEALERQHGKPSKVWRYDDAAGEMAGAMVRWDGPPGKKILPISRDGQGGWTITGMATPRPLYRLPELAAAEVVCVCEGEKAADAAKSIGLTATTSAHGSKSAKGTDWTPLGGKQGVIFPDNDGDGEHYASEVAKIVTALKPPASVKIVRLPGLPAGGDIVEWLQSGGTAEELAKLVAEAPEWQPTNQVHIGSVSPAMGLSNVRTFGEDLLPVPMAELVPLIIKQAGDWPRRVEDNLFFDGGEQGVLWLDSASSLFGWLAGKCGVIDWRKIIGACPKEEVFHETKRRARRYDAIEDFPHEPPIANHYYTCGFPQAGDGQALGTLLNYFAPETEHDRQLLIAAFATPLWGGLPGARPAFLFTSAEGRGKGKTKAAEAVARLYGGFVAVSPNEDIGAVKTRLLSPEAISKRCTLCDNVKAARFSWGDLEALITADTVNGKRLYVGDGSRPNYLTWLITLNGASLSTDMAQRTVEVKLATPTYTGDWERELYEFIDANREAVLADLVGFLRRPQGSLARYSRWGTWDQAVVSRLDNPDACTALIAERRGAVDAEQEEGEDIEHHFASRLRRLGYSPDTSDVFIPNTVATQWYSEATNIRGSKTTAVTRALRQLHDEGRLPSILQYRAGDSGRERGFRWVGVHCDSQEPTDYHLLTRLAKADREAETEDGPDTSIPL